MLALTTAITVTALAAGAGATPAPVTEPYEPSIDPADFGGPIDNPYLPLRPGAIDKQYEKKWYARGVGVVQEDAITMSREHSELVSVTVP